MPASRRHHRALAVLVNCLGILAAVPAVHHPAPHAAPVAVAVPAPEPPAPEPAAPGPGGPAPAAPAAPAPGGPVPNAPAPGGAAPNAPGPGGAAPNAPGPAAPMPAASDATVPTGPAGTAAPAGPATPRAAGSGTATPPSRQLVRAIAPGAVTVAMSSAGTPAPGYRIEVRNASGTPVPATVRQELPDGTRATTVTAGGTTTRAAGRAAPGEITWQLTLPARSTTTLHTALSAPPRGRAVTAPACALSEDGSQPYDCATATWSGGTVAAAEVTPAPVWRRTPVLLAALTAALVITIGALWWWQRGRRGRATAAGPGRPPASAGGPGTPLYSGVPVRGSVYPQPAAPGPARRRRTPPVWLAVGVAAAVLAGVVGAAAWTATQRVAAIDTQKQPTSGAWVGRTVSGPVGAPLRETAFEFTVYRVACAAAATAVSDRECQATVGVRNLTPEQQTWHGQLQRAYLPGGTWVSADEAATRAANQGRDVFAEPVSAGSRKVLPLVFTVNGTDAPKQLELRSGVFSAGVRVDVP